MKKLQTKALTLTVVFISLFSFACQKENSGQGISAGKSSVNIFLTDDPSLIFDKVLLDITKVEVKVEDDSEQQHESEHQQGDDDNDQHGETSGGWMSDHSSRHL